MVAPMDESVEPSNGLGDNFAKTQKRLLDFKARARLLGASPADGWEPADLPDRASVKQMVIARDGGCVHCGTETTTLELDSINDIHEDVDDVNLAAVDPLCHGYHHLDELGEGNGIIAFIPGIDRTDLNHLQRLLIGDFFHGDDVQKKVATDLLDWLASHGRYVEECFGTHDPAVFGKVLSGVKPEYSVRGPSVFRDLCLVFNPRLFGEHAATWRQEDTATHPRETWSAFATDVSNLTP